ncbi:unnamed protein product [Amoebophrya sp. A120]|nr:unnamed protein product [Amoebophrya sp. A120]|eukprot:GSA120T00025568001.1
MWWTGRIPGMSEEDDRKLFEEEKKAEQLGQDLMQEIMDLLGENGPPPIPPISFERVPGDMQGLVKPREIHVRGPNNAPVPYRGPGKTPYYRISNTEATIVKQTLEYNGFRELTTNGIGLGISPHDWVVQWSGPNYRDYVYQNLHEYQYVNHFSGSTEMTRKDRIWCHFQAMQRLFGKLQFDFVPETFVIPDQLEAFIQVYEKTDYLWIVKPHASSRGRGIFILQELSEIPLDCLTVICRYVENPYLIQGLKFDLRLYVLVTGFDPLRIYLFKEGLTRFASSVFSTTEEDLGNVYKHLTNYSINKYASNFVENEDAAQDNVGHKWSLSALNKHLACCNVDVKLMWSRIIDVLIKCILSVERPIVNKMKSTVSWRSNCFELYGFDLLLDEGLKPHLLEVNLSPSMQADTPLDYKVKSALVQETFNLLGPKLADQKQLGETRWKSRAKQLKRQGQRIPYGQPLAASNAGSSTAYASAQALKPTVLNTPAARAREAERQQKFHNLQKKNLPLATLGEKPLRLLLECVQEFSMAHDFIRVFPTQASVKRYGHMIGIGSTAKSMSASQLLCLALFNEPRLARARNGSLRRSLTRGSNAQTNKTPSTSPNKQTPAVQIDNEEDGISAETASAINALNKQGASEFDDVASTASGISQTTATSSNFTGVSSVTGIGTNASHLAGNHASGGISNFVSGNSSSSSSSSSSSNVAAGGGNINHNLGGRGSSAKNRVESPDLAALSRARNSNRDKSRNGEKKGKSGRRKSINQYYQNTSGLGVYADGGLGEGAEDAGEQGGRWPLFQDEPPPIQRSRTQTQENLNGRSNRQSVSPTRNSGGGNGGNSSSSTKKLAKSKAHTVNQYPATGNNNNSTSNDQLTRSNSLNNSNSSSQEQQYQHQQPLVSPANLIQKKEQMKNFMRYEDHNEQEQAMRDLQQSQNGGNGTAGGNNSSSTSSNGEQILNTHNFYWSTSVVSTEGSKRGLDALEKRINGMNGSSSVANASNFAAQMLQQQLPQFTVNPEKPPPPMHQEAYHNSSPRSSHHQRSVNRDDRERGRSNAVKQSYQTGAGGTASPSGRSPPGKSRQPVIGAGSGALTTSYAPNGTLLHPNNSGGPMLLPTGGAQNQQDPANASPNKLRNQSVGNWQSYYRNYGQNLADNDPNRPGSPQNRVLQQINRTRYNGQGGAPGVEMMLEGPVMMENGSPLKSRSMNGASGGQLHGSSQDLQQTAANQAASSTSSTLHNAKVSALARKAYPTNNLVEQHSELIGPPVDVNWSPKQRPRALSMPRPRTAERKSNNVSSTTSSVIMGVDIEL